MQNLLQKLLPRKEDGSPNQPYHFQLRTAVLLLEGKNVVLNAPTGAGKTWTALLPYVYAKQKGLTFADKIIYCLPLRTLASALYESTRKVLGEHGIKTTIQMGNQPEDPHFQGQVIFTTIDQLLSAYIGLAYGTSKRMSNIPPGALIGSYVVIDEFHLLSYTEAFPTFLDMVERLRPYVRFLFMTATATGTMLTELERHLNGQAVMLTPEEHAALPKKHREIHWSDTPLTPEDVLNKHLGKRTLVVVNTVGRAQRLYEEVTRLIEQQQGNQPEVRMLHARLFAEDRSEREAWAREAFKRNSTNNAILIATQVVEAGMDISADVMMTDLCPMNALVQRMGRCSRYAGESGKVYVFGLDSGKPGQYLPYANNGDPDNIGILLRTEKLLQSLSPAEPVTPEKESEWVRLVHEELDQERIRRMFESLFIRRQEITKALITGQADTGELIRHVDQITLMIHYSPLHLEQGKALQMVSLARNTWEKYIKSLGIPDFGKFQMVWIPEEAPEAHPSSQEWIWRNPRNLTELYHQTLLLVSPQLADYHPEMGLLLRYGRGTVVSQSVDLKKLRMSWPYSYSRETYLEHVEKVRKCHNLQQEEVRRATNCLARGFQIMDSQLEKVSELCAAAHDIGKLNVEIQVKFRKWQKEYHNKPETELLAHTDYDGRAEADRKAYQEGGYRPVSHAPEGAAALQGWLASEFGVDIASAMQLAIARHHGAQVSHARAFDFAKGSVDCVAKSMEGLGFAPKLRPVKSSVEFDALVRQLEKPRVLALYWYLVRRLRLADQASFSEVDS